MVGNESTPLSAKEIVIESYQHLPMVYSFVRLA